MKRSALILLVSLFGAAACSPLDQANLAFAFRHLSYRLIDRPTLQAQLQANRDKWEQAEIHSYEYETKSTYFCPDEPPLWVIIRVEDDNIVAVKNAADGTPVDPQYFDSYRTVNDLFEVVQSDLDTDADFYLVEVQFDSELGYPTEINSITSPQIADGGGTITASNLVLP